VLLNAQGRPVRPPAEIIDAFGPQMAEFTPQRLAAAARPPHAERATFDVRRSELDPMGHVNNAAYLDYLDEHYLADAARATLAVPRRYRAEFLASAEPGARLTSVGWADGPVWRYRLDDDSARELFRANLDTDAANWVDG
jgi:acyl-ACP thioesterase